MTAVTQIPSTEIATFTTYAQAQQAVDALSDAKFDVARVQIVGRGLHTVEQVTGRMANGKAAGYGALSGLWFGLFVGLLFSIFAPGGLWLWPLLSAMIAGAIFGALFGWFGHLMTGGRRDFASVKSLTAEQYAVMVDEPLADQAAAILNR